MAHSWYYNPSLKMCLGGDTAYCGMTGNQYPNCEACMKACNVSVCAEKITTTHEPYDDAWEVK
ncbi:hypothetical protein MRX96_045538 [Rhipicephalus microplus]